LSSTQGWAARSGRPTSDAGDVLARLIEVAHGTGRPLMFGLRLWAAVCLTLYIAFWLELDTPYWAATTAVIVCQPSLGASLRKASFRLIGTLVGAVAIVILTISFPQSRVGFLLGLALWGALCGLFASVLQNFAAYAAALAGYTAAIIAIDQLGSTGGAHGDVLMLAINRASEICIGIVCAGVVLAGTDFGHARRRLVAQFAGLAAAISHGFSRVFVMSEAELVKVRPIRRELIRRVAALSPVIDEAIGESSELRYRSRALQAAVDGLFAAVTGWRTIAHHFETTGQPDPRETQGVLSVLPDELRAAPAAGSATSWAADPLALQLACRTAVRKLLAMQVATAPAQMIADHAARALVGLSRAFGGLALLMHPAGAAEQPQLALLRVPDWLPSIVTAIRVFLTIGAVELFWIATAWPNGAGAIAFAAIITILLAPLQDQAYAASRVFLLGTTLSAVLAAVVAFAVLPHFVDFSGFSLVLGAVLIPLGALSAQPWNPQLFVAAAINFIPMLGPQNQMTYNTQQFYNSALAILLGVFFGVLAFRLLPPVSPARRTRRLLALTLRDLRRLITERKPMPRDEWESRVYGRLAVLPQQSELEQAAQLAAALAVGLEVIRLRSVADRFGVRDQAAAALAALAAGDDAAALRGFAALDRALAAIQEERPGRTLRLRLRGSIRTISEALVQFPDYFAAGEVG
jgi:uncharacterized membrane protein YccC